MYGSRMNPGDEGSRLNWTLEGFQQPRRQFSRAGEPYTVEGAVFEAAVFHDSHPGSNHQAHGDAPDVHVHDVGRPILVLWRNDECGFTLESARRIEENDRRADDPAPDELDVSYRACILEEVGQIDGGAFVSHSSEDNASKECRVGRFRMQPRHLAQLGELGPAIPLARNSESALHGCHSR